MSILLVFLLAANPTAEAEAALALARAARERPQPVKVAAVKPATHSHRCPFDGTIWSHSDDSFGKIEDHKCPKCGRVQWQVYQRFR